MITRYKTTITKENLSWRPTAFTYNKPPLGGGEFGSQRVNRPVSFMDTMFALNCIQQQLWLGRGATLMLYI